MFSDNQKISSRQLHTLLITDWLGKVVLLLPASFQGASAWTILAGTVAGFAASELFLCLAVSVADRGKRDFFFCVKERLCSWAALLLYLIYGVYFLCHGAIMLYLCGRIGGTYLLPETSGPLLIALPAIVGYYLARGGMEVRGRISELLAFLIWWAFLFLLLFALPGVRPHHLLAGGGIDAGGLMSFSAIVFASFGGVGALPLAFPQVVTEGGKQERAKSLRGAGGKALAMVAFVLIITFLIGYGLFGQEGMARLEWPVITVMSSTNLQGVFLQRWDVLLVGLLLFAMFLSAGTGIYYVSTAGETLGMKRKPAQCGAVALAYLLAVFLSQMDGQRVFSWYRNISFRICVPGMVLFVGILLLAERTRNHKRRADILDKKAGDFNDKNEAELDSLQSGIADMCDFSDRVHCPGTGGTPVSSGTGSGCEG